MTQKIIDIHPHIISPDTTAYPYNPLGGIRSDWSAERPFTFEQYVEEMEAAGVSQAAMVHSSTTYGYDNSYAADSVCRDPERFVGVYSVDIAAPDAVAIIEKWRRRGMAGLRLFGAGSTVQTDGRWMIAPETYKVWEHMAEIDMTVAIQTTSIGLPAVEEILERFPEVSIILDHLGRPDLTDGAPYAKPRRSGNWRSSEICFSRSRRGRSILRKRHLPRPRASLRSWSRNMVRTGWPGGPISPPTTAR